MVRKDSIVAVVMGCVLLVSACALLAWAVHPQGGGRPSPYDDSQIPWGYVLIMNMAILGVAPLWWPLVRRPRVPAHPVLRVAACIVGGLFLLGVVVILGIQLVFGDAESMVAFACLYGLTLVVHAAALSFFMTRPRLLVAWVIGILLSPLFCAGVYMLVIPRPQWASEMVLFYVVLAVWVGPVAAPLLGLPFAWWWVKSAEKRAAKKQAVAAQRQGE